MALKASAHRNQPLHPANEIRPFLEKFSKICHGAQGNDGKFLLLKHLLQKFHRVFLAEISRHFRQKTFSQPVPAMGIGSIHIFYLKRLLLPDVNRNVQPVQLF